MQISGDTIAAELEFLIESIKECDKVINNEKNGEYLKMRAFYKIKNYEEKFFYCCLIFRFNIEKALQFKEEALTAAAKLNNIEEVYKIIHNYLSTISI